jgi:hypothetical protein
MLDVIKTFDFLTDLAVEKAKKRAAAKTVKRSKAKAKASKKAPAKPAAKSAGKSAAKSPAKPMRKPTTKPAAKPVSKPAAKPRIAVTKPTPSKPAASPAPAKPSAKPSAKSASKRKGYKWQTVDGKWWTRQVSGDSSSQRIPYVEAEHGDRKEVNSEGHEKAMHKVEDMKDLISKASEGLASVKRADVMKIVRATGKKLAEAVTNLKHNMGTEGSEVWEESQKKVKDKLLRILRSEKLLGEGKSKDVDSKTLKDIEKMLKMFADKPSDEPRDEVKGKKLKEEFKQKLSQTLSNPRATSDDYSGVLRGGLGGLLELGAGIGKAMLAMAIPLLILLAVGALL